MAISLYSNQQSFAKLIEEASKQLTGHSELRLSSGLKVRKAGYGFIEWLRSIFGADSTRGYKKTAAKLEALALKRSAEIPFEGDLRDQFNKEYKNILGKVLHITEKDDGSLEVDAKLTKNVKKTEAIKKRFTDSLDKVKKIEVTEEAKEIQRKQLNILDELEALKANKAAKAQEITGKHEEISQQQKAIEDLQALEDKDEDAIAAAKESLKELSDQLSRLEEENDALAISQKTKEEERTKNHAALIAFQVKKKPATSNTKPKADPKKD